MKRFTTAFAASFLIPLSAAPTLGQTLTATGLTITGGLNMASMASSPDDGVPSESVMGVAIGLAAGVSMSEGLQFQLGAGYSQKGADVGRNDLGGRVKIDYLELTALADMPFAVGKGFGSVHLLGGPALGLRLSCQGTIRLLGEERKVDCNDTTAGMDLGVAGGVLLDVGLSDKAGVVVGVLYNHGLLNTSTDPESTETTVRTRTLTLRAGLAYPLG